MLRCRILKLGALLAAACAGGLSAGPASATLALNQSGAFVVVPILAGIITVNAGPSATWSYATLTNTSDQNVTLHLNFIDGGVAMNGDIRHDWSAVDFSCPVTGQETVLFAFRPTANGSVVDFKCSFAVPTANGVQVVSTPTTLNLPFQRGLLTAAVESPAGTTVSSNLLVGDWLVVDFNVGAAFGTEAISFQGLSALAQDGDRNYRFDGKEYATFPAQVASDFIAPNAGPQPTIVPFLVLFTLDGTTGGQPAAPGGQVNPVQLRGNVYNDREESQSFNFSFDCFALPLLSQLSPAFVNTGAGGFMSTAGHFDLTPVATGAGDPAHEFNFGNGNNVRKRPVLGWIYELFFTGARIPDAPAANPSPPFPGAQRLAFRARPLGTSVTSFTPLTGDTPTFSSN